MKYKHNIYLTFLLTLSSPIRIRLTINTYLHVCLDLIFIIFYNSAARSLIAQYYERLLLIRRFVDFYNNRIHGCRRECK